MNYGKAIKEIRTMLKDNQEGFSLNIGITQGHLSSIEKGNKNPSPKVLSSISDYSDIPLPIISWMAVEEKDVPENKKDAFLILKSNVDNFVADFLN